MSYDEIMASLGSTTAEENAEVAETKAVELADCVWARLAELYEAYYEISTPAEQCRMDVEVALSGLMVAYNAWLG